MGKRLNDTAALVSNAEGINSNISVRKISNGHVTRVSHCGPEGYEEREFFSKKAPRIVPARVERDDSGDERLSDTKRYLERGR